MEIDDIFGYAKLSVMQISFRVLAILTLATLGHLSSHAARGAEKPMMKAIVAHEYGGPEVLKLEEVSRPEPKENEALVRVIASGVNPADPLTLSGKYAREFGTHLPLIPGYDIAGIVEKPNFWRRLGGLRHRHRGRGRCEARVAEFHGRRSGADGRFDRVAGVGRRGAAPCRANHSHSRWLWRRW